MGRNVLAVVVGWVVGGIVNVALIAIGPMLVPPPAGVDMTTLAGMEAGVALLQPRHFLFPWLAHAVGTLVGAALAARIARHRPMALALTVGALFLAGGIGAATMIPAPAWFIALDLVTAYLPMAWLGGWLRAARPAARLVASHRRST
jgi:hypothetical protein